jgi:uncharacterized protein involved in oxidation of intracellular sulfur
LKFET